MCLKCNYYYIEYKLSISFRELLAIALLFITRLTSKMIGVALKEGHLSMTEAEIPQPQPGEALLRVLQVGVCNTDIELARGFVQSIKLKICFMHESFLWQL